MPVMSIEDTIQMFRSVDWDFATADTLAGPHGLHPYPAKFPPQLPRAVIATAGPAEGLIIDPFGGSGTTAIEAAAQGFSSWNIDANPVAVRLTQAKADGLTEREQSTLLGWLQEEVYERSLEPHRSRCTCLAEGPEIFNRDKWFSDQTYHELYTISRMRQVIEFDPVVHNLATLALGQTAAKQSFQDSETRYVSVPRTVVLGEAVRHYAATLLRMVEASSGPDFRGYVTMRHGDSRVKSSWPVDNSGGLLITSPPYPNSYDYHLYHRFRILWTDYSPKDLRRVEIGSHLTHQGNKDLIASYESDMTSVLRSSWLALSPDSLAIFVVGDGKVKGMIYETARNLVRLARGLGFEHLTTINRKLPSRRRSVTRAGRRLETEQIVVLKVRK